MYIYIYIYIYIIHVQRVHTHYERPGWLRGAILNMNILIAHILNTQYANNTQYSIYSV